MSNIESENNKLGGNMNESEIRQAAQMYALVAEMEAVKAMIEGIKVENAHKTSQGLPPAYSSGYFFEAETELVKIASRLRDEI